MPPTDGPAPWPVGGADLGPDCHVGQGVVFGSVREARLRSGEPPAPVRVGSGCLIGHYVVIGDGTTIGDNVFIDHHCRIGYGCRVGNNVRIEFEALVTDRVIIENGAVVAGIVGDAATIGEGAINLGILAHELSKPTTTPWGVEEPAPRVEARAVIGRGSVVVGDVVIGAGAYIAAGAIVTKSVPPDHIVIKYNEAIPLTRWKGARLERRPEPPT